MFDFLSLGFAEVQWIVLTALGIYAWVINKHSASAKELLELHVRVVELEHAVKDMPSKVDVVKLQGQLDSVNQRIEVVHRGVSRIENYFLESKK